VHTARVLKHITAAPYPRITVALPVKDSDPVAVESAIWDPPVTRTVLDNILKHGATAIVQLTETVYAIVSVGVAHSVVVQRHGGSTESDLREKTK